MDILSHGLWGGVSVGRKSKKSFWTAFTFGVFPDAFAFGLPISHLLFSMITGGPADFMRGPEDGYANIPSYVFSLYNISHSLVIFLSIFLIVWAIRKKPMWEMGAWGFHVLLDIFTHSDKFFPTPFLWPLSSYTFDGISWGQPMIFFPNVVLLALLYSSWWYIRRKNRVV